MFLECWSLSQTHHPYTPKGLRLNPKLNASEYVLNILQFVLKTITKFHFILNKFLTTFHVQVFPLKYWNLHTLNNKRL
jgi:hypothetical protein